MIYNRGLVTKRNHLKKKVIFFFYTQLQPSEETLFWYKLYKTHTYVVLLQVAKLHHTRCQHVLLLYIQNWFSYSNCLHARGTIMVRDWLHVKCCKLCEETLLFLTLYIYICAISYLNAFAFYRPFSNFSIQFLLYEASLQNKLID